ncbi:MAG: phosphotransferase, partial [SAR324 cluster bacterium]|nr:phosphotransferase [SAR324 cluster bacterium]
MGRIRAKISLASNFGALIYSTVGASALQEGQGYPLTIKEFIQKHFHQPNADELTQAYQGLFNQVLKSLYRNSQKQENQPILSQFTQLLSKQITVEWRNPPVQEQPDLQRINLDFDSYPPRMGFPTSKKNARKAVQRLQKEYAQLSQLRPGDLVCIEGGQLSESEINTNPSEAKFRVSHPKSNLLIEVKAPERLSKAPMERDSGLGALVRDPRIRLNRTMPPIYGVVVETLRDTFLEKQKKNLKHPGFESLKKDTKPVKLKFTGLMSPLTDPLDFLLNDFDFFRSCPMTLATIHGDLNTGNIMVWEDRQSQGLWLIDFAKTTWGLVAFDLAKHEIELRHQILIPWMVSFCDSFRASAVPEQYIQETLQRACLIFELGIEAPENQLSPEPSNSPYVETILGDLVKQPQFQNIQQIVRQIRGWRDQLKLGREEYLYSLFFYGLACIKFQTMEKNKALIPYPAYACYLTSAYALLQLEQLTGGASEEILPDLETLLKNNNDEDSKKEEIKKEEIKKEEIKKVCKILVQYAEGTANQKNQ